MEIDPERARAVRDLFAGVPNVRVLEGYWRQLLVHGPFDLLFADGSKAKEREPEALVGVLKPGGTVFLDDLTPEALWPEEWRGRADPVRQFWLHDRRLAAAEISTGPAEAAIVAVRL